MCSHKHTATCQNAEDPLKSTASGEVTGLDEAGAPRKVKNKIGQEKIAPWHVEEGETNQKKKYGPRAIYLVYKISVFGGGRPL